MIIQSKAMGYTPTQCPYSGVGVAGGCGRCPVCEKARSRARLGQLALVAGDVRGYSMAGFGAFGVPSYWQRNPDGGSKDCSVGDFDGKPGGWEAYCDCMYEPGPIREKCKVKVCAPFTFNPWQPGYCTADPRWAFAPWTEPGAGTRGIPLPKAGILYSTFSVLRPGDVDEFEPDRFIRLLLLDPVRANSLLVQMSLATVGDLLQAKLADAAIKAAFTTAAAIGSAAAVGTVIATPVPLLAPLAYVGAQVAVLLPLAIPYSLSKDPTGERLNRNVLEPLMDLGIDAVGLVVGLLGSGAVPAVVAFGLNRAAKNLPKPPDDFSDQAKAEWAATWAPVEQLLKAAAKVAPLIAQIATDPTMAFATEGSYAKFGAVLKQVAEQLPPASAGVKTDVLNVAQFLLWFDPSLTRIAQAIVRGDFTRVCCDDDSAIDVLLVKVPPIEQKFSTIARNANALVEQGKLAFTDANKILLGGPEAAKALGQVGDLFDSVQKFAMEVDKTLSSLGSVGRFFSEAFARMTGQEVRQKLDRTILAASAPDSAAQLRATGFNTAGGAMMVAIAGGLNPLVASAARFRTQAQASVRPATAAPSVSTSALMVDASKLRFLPQISPGLRITAADKLKLLGERAEAKADSDSGKTGLILAVVGIGAAALYFGGRK